MVYARRALSRTVANLQAGTWTFGHGPDVDAGVLVRMQKDLALLPEQQTAARLAHDDALTRGPAGRQWCRNRGTRTPLSITQVSDVVAAGGGGPPVSGKAEPSSPCITGERRPTRPPAAIVSIEATKTAVSPHDRNTATISEIAPNCTSARRLATTTGRDMRSRRRRCLAALGTLRPLLQHSDVLDSLGRQADPRYLIRRWQMGPCRGAGRCVPRSAGDSWDPARRGPCRRVSERHVGSVMMLATGRRAEYGRDRRADGGHRGVGCHQALARQETG